METSNRCKQLEAIFIATPPQSPLHNNLGNLNSVTRTTTPRDLPTIRGIFEEYQQLNELLVGEKVENGCNENAPPNGNGNEYGNRNVSGNGNGKGNINVFQQPPQRSSFNSSSLSEAQQQQQQQQQQQTQRQHHLSTFSRVCNTFSLRRNSSNNNNNIINNKQPPNAKSSITDSDNNECGDGEDIDVPPPGPLTTGYSIPISEDPFDSAKPTDLTPCPNCSRTFNLNALRKHVAICEKTSKKRKLFDSSRQRREGTSLSTYVLPKNFGLPNAEKAAGVHSPPLSSRDTAQPEVSTPLPTRRNSKAKAQRKTSNSEGGAGGGASSSAAAPASSSSGAPAAPALDRRDPKRSSDRPKRSIKDTASDRCPHCDRTFNPKAFDRHVEWCKEKAVQAAIKAANSTETAKAKERLDARKQYKPPNLKTKRSMNRDKYSHHEELLEAGEMMAPKPSLMTLSSMTSSVHSENPEIKAVQQPATPRLEGRRGRRGSITTVTENSVKLQMANDEEPEPPSPPPPQRAATLQSRSKRHQHANDTCDGVDQTISRIRRAASREALQLAKLDNDNKTEIVPRASTGKLRKAQSNNEKLDMIEAMSAETNQVTMRFDELNGLIKRKGVTPSCNLEMDEPELKISTKSRSSTSLVRQARRRPRTREHPSLEMRAIAGELGSSSDLRAQKTTESLEIDNNDQMVPLQRVARDRVMYSGSEDEGAEIQIKLETTTTRTLCRPKKRSNKLPQLTGSAEPMKALPMPQLKQSLEVLGHNISQAQLPRLDIGNERLEEDDLDNDSISDELEEMEVVAPAKSSAKNRQIKSRTISRTRNNCTPELLEDQERQIKSRTISRTMKARSPEDLSLDQEDLEPIKLPPLVKQGSNVSRRLVLLEEDENGTMYIKDAPSAGNNQTLESSRSRTSGGGGRNRVKSGDKYDPFLSAKRQLEELCSPSTPPEVTNLTPLATPSIAMSTSLTSAAKPIAASTPKVTPISNFRRTSSLRGTRRAPLLSSRPLFATNYRPTIQRGLSDEGPISSNFLKPEEFDEMPVRAACGNDFHSPRVVRRDTSASNRKQQLKLPLGGGGGGGGVGICGGITPTPSNGPGESESPAPVRNVAKTDSLAVFLKYEHDLEQLNAKAAAEMTSKELKDKSNNLSKQNSAKSLLQPGQLPVLSPPATAATAAPPQFQATNSISVNSSSSNIKESNENVPRATFPLIGSKPNTITAPTPVATAPSTNTPIKLESIFIDPKLINACDNLHLGVANRVPSDTSSTTPHNPLQSRSRSSSQSTITQEQRRHSGEARNLFKRKMRLGRNQFLYDASPEDASSGCCSADDEANRSSMEYDEQCWQQQQKQLLANPHLPMPTITPTLAPLVMPSHNNLMPSFDNFDFEEFLSSFENENDEEQFPLFRDCREFLMNRTKRSSSKTNNNIFTATPPQTTTTMTTNNNLVANNSIKSNFAHRCDSSDEKLMRQQSNVSSISSHENDKEKRMADQQKREIFISIETEANAQGRSPISPDSLRHMVGNPQTKIDVLHIDNGNEPEHAKFSKISDTEEADSDLRFDDKVKQQQSQLTSSSNLLGANATPNVQLNNAKNLIQQMQSEFRQLGEDASASMRRAMLRTEESSTKEREREVAQQKPEQIVTATSSHSGDSDEFSSLDGYPMSSSQSSRREGANSKLSSDSAYGSSNSPYSLSRQRSSELAANSPRSGPLLRPHTANAKLMDASTQAQTAYGTLKARQRLFAGGAAGDGNPDGAESSSSASDNSVHHKNNNKQQPTPTTSQQSLASSNSSMSSSMKMSKFCHECGGKFVLEHAKFCMECGVRRVVL
ncbi:uncharacterized protein Dwil_GK17934 [Drosophila willistoni]|uniref:C2HC/C3H-type domain-containing protein n=1 Tax=Drosophila willistoni TaxID=7260 RepID=B4N5T2_DROWI|nr:uncharacterized protein Dwil_GK17934 [Drosophila willistoni]